MARIKTLIMGAAGRDFHNFNVVYRNNRRYDVVAFTATQIPNIDDRKYPASLAGKLYPKGIPIYDESELEALIRTHGVQEVVFSYSDVPYGYVMNRSSIANAAGAHFKVLGAAPTMVKSKKPPSFGLRRGTVGKSQTSRRIIEILMAQGLKVVAIRHPMPYGNLAAQKVQRFAEIADLEKHKCTVEEMEEYEPHVVRGNVIYAGVDYEAILRAAEKDPKGCDVILWDGGNNDMSFYTPDLHIVVADPLRVGNELTYYPSEANLRMADAVVINKVDTADIGAITQLRANIRKVNATAVMIDAASPIFVKRPERIAGKRALVIEDGPTLTHGEMKFGAGIVAAHKFGASEIIDPRPYTVGTITETFRKYPGIGTLLPAMGYGDEQVRDLQETINKVPCDVVIIGTPIDLNRIVKIKKPSVRVMYDLQEIGKPDLKGLLDAFVAKHVKK
jgi:predicted GTPase